MMSVDSNFNFLCGRPHGAGPPPPVHMRPPEPDPLPPPCGRHKWMAPNINSRLMVKVKMQKTLYTQPGYSVHMEYRSGQAIVLYHRGLTLNAELLDGGLGVWRGCTGEHSPRVTGPTGYASSAICIRSIGLENIHSFIHSGYLYSAPSRNLLRGALSPATVKEKCLKKLAERRDVVLR